MSDLSTRQKYVIERRQGYSGPEAAERAGFAGRPGPDARRCWEAAQQEAGGNLAARAGTLKEELEYLEFRRKQLRLRLEAVEALQQERE